MKVKELDHFLIDQYIIDALKEDMNGEDISTNSVIDSVTRGQVTLICKETGVLAGIGVFKRVFELLEADVQFDISKEDGDQIEKGEELGTITASIQTLLGGERVALNFLQRMCGIASYTRQVVDKLEDSPTQIVDSRKTTPNFRLFEKYAVRVGGGGNHRYNLTDGVLLKDNHIGAAGSVSAAIEAAKAYAPFVRKIEVEVETLDMVAEALEAGADIIMLDNMSPEMIQEALEMIDGKATVELSGNISLNNIDLYKDLGADIISSGSLTHSAPVLDLSLKHLHKI